MMNDPITLAKQKMMELLNTYLVERDIKKAMSYWVENAIYIEWNSPEITFHKQNIQSILSKYISSHPAPINFSLEQLNAVTSAPNIVTLYGKLMFTSTQPFQFYAVLQNENAELKVSQFICMSQHNFGDFDLFQLVNSLPGGITVMQFTQNRWEQLFVNDGYYQLSKDTKNYSPMSMIHPQDYKKLKYETSKQASLNEPFHVEYRMIKKNGEIVWIMLNGMPFPSTCPIFYLCTYTNITEQKQIEGNAETARMNLVNVLESMPSAVIVTALDKQNTLLYSNNAFFHFAGYDLSDFPGNLEKDTMSIILDEDKQKLQNFKDKPYKHGDTFSQELRIRRKDGQMGWILTIARKVIYNNQPANISIAVDITQTKKIQEELKRINTQLEIEHNRFNAIAKLTGTLFYEYNIEKDLMTYSEDAIIEPYQNRVEEHYQSTIEVSDNIHPQDKSNYINFFHHPEIESLEFRCKDHCGNWIWSLIRGITIYDKRKAPLLVIGTISNIHEQVMEREKLRYSSQRDPLTGIFNRTSIENEINYYLSVVPEDQVCALFILDIDDFKNINDNLGHPFGDFVLKSVSDKILHACRPNDIVGRIGGDEFVIFLKDIKNRITAEERAIRICKMIKNLGLNNQFEISCSIGIALSPEIGTTYATLIQNADIALYSAKNKGKDGYQNYCPGDKMGDYANKALTKMDSDLSMLNRLSNSLTQNNDALTGIPTMHQFKCQVDALLAHQKQSYTLVSFDIVKFQRINNSLGYHIGDLILKTISDYILSNISSDEYCCRIGADHFAILFAFHHRALLKKRLQTYHIQLVSLLEDTFTDLQIRFVTGIYFVNKEDRSATLLLDRANFARKMQKTSHGFGYALYDETSAAREAKEDKIDELKHKALKNHEFKPYVQPKIDLKNGKINGLEVLARWDSPELGHLQPNDFIPLFEKTAFIQDLDFYLLETMCKKLREMINEGICPLPISINQSRVHVHNISYVEKVIHLLDHFQIPHELIELEITESIFLENMGEVMKNMLQFRSQGIKISIDDFGSGYSSLNMLKDAPIDILKLDRGFLSKSASSDSGRFIIQKVVEMAHGLNIKVVCEGVETMEQVVFLQSIDCDVAQGYFYFKPMPLEEFTALSREKNFSV